MTAADVSWTIEPVALPPAKHLAIDKLEAQLKDRNASFLMQEEARSDPGFLFGANKSAIP